MLTCAFVVSVRRGNTEWYSYLHQAQTPDYVDQFVFMPAVLDSERAQFEAVSGHPITDLACTGALDPEYVSDSRPRPIDYVPNFSKCVNVSVTHVRAKQPYYFPYTYKVRVATAWNAHLLIASRWCTDVCLLSLYLMSSCCSP
jgi:hypothetical protein